MRGPQHRINDQIRVPEVRVIGINGDMLGVMDTRQALQLAREEGVDLIEISPKAEPPVCKIEEYGKYLYAVKKRENEAKKAQAKVELKGIRLSFRMDTGDFDRQIKLGNGFLEDGNSVRIQLMMRGREQAHGDIALQKVEEYISKMIIPVLIEAKPTINGRQIIAVIKPKK